jgi:hypothetical protein
LAVALAFGGAADEFHRVVTMRRALLRPATARLRLAPKFGQ